MDLRGWRLRVGRDLVGDARVGEAGDTPVLGQRWARHKAVARRVIRRYVLPDAHAAPYAQTDL